MSKTGSGDSHNAEVHRARKLLDRRGSGDVYRRVVIETRLQRIPPHVLTQAQALNQAAAKPPATASRGRASTKAQPAQPRKVTSKPAERNPTFDDARDYVRTWFTRQRDLGSLLVDMKDAGFRLYLEFSGQAFNAEDSMAKDMFELALSLVPAAAVLGKTWKTLSTGTEAFAKLVENLEAAAKAVEASESVAKPGGVVVGAARSGTAVEEGKARSEFSITVIKSLAELRVDNIQRAWQSEDRIIAALEAHKMAPAALNLLALVSGSFGPIPSADGLKEAMEQASVKFELELYLAYFVKGGRAYWIQIGDSAGNVYSKTLHGVPRGVEERLDMLLPGWSANLRVEVQRHAVSGKFA